MKEALDLADRLNPMKHRKEAVKLSRKSPDLFQNLILCIRLHNRNLLRTCVLILEIHHFSSGRPYLHIGPLIMLVRMSSVHTVLRLSSCLSICLSVCMSVCLSAFFMKIRDSSDLHVRLSVRPTVCTSVFLSLYVC